MPTLAVQEQGWLWEASAMAVPPAFRVCALGFEVRYRGPYAQSLAWGQRLFGIAVQRFFFLMGSTWSEHWVTVVWGWKLGHQVLWSSWKREESVHCAKTPCEVSLLRKHGRLFVFLCRKRMKFVSWCPKQYREEGSAWLAPGPWCLAWGCSGLSQRTLCS